MLTRFAVRFSRFALSARLLFTERDLNGCVELAQRVHLRFCNSAIRVFTIFRTSTLGSGLSGGNRIVPFDVS